jgi:hypothetical protein
LHDAHRRQRPQSDAPSPADADLLGQIALGRQLIARPGDRRSIRRRTCVTTCSVPPATSLSILLAAD